MWGVVANVQTLALCVQGQSQVQGFEAWLGLASTIGGGGAERALTLMKKQAIKYIFTLVG